MFAQPYIFFDGRCDEALEFYKRSLGAEVTMLMRFKDSPDLAAQGGCAPGTADKVMHANVTIRDTQIMMSDGEGHGSPKFEGFGMALNATDVADAEKLFAALNDGGNVMMPLTETFFADKFGMLTDKFGVMWMIMSAKK